MIVTVQSFIIREVIIHKVATIQKREEPPIKNAKIEPEKRTEIRTATFVPLQDVLDINWSSKTYAERLPKADSSYFLMRGIVRCLRVQIKQNGSAQIHMIYSQDVPGLNLCQDTSYTDRFFMIFVSCK